MVDVLGWLAFKAVAVDGEQIAIDQIVEAVGVCQRSVEIAWHKHTVDEGKILIRSCGLVAV